MTTVILDVRSLNETLNDFSKAWKTAKAEPPRISFDSVELLFKLLTAKRWALIHAMTGAGPITIREAARRVKRDVKSVHGDIHILLNAGILQRTEKGRIVFPFDGVHVDFMLHNACVSEEPEVRTPPIPVPGKTHSIAQHEAYS